LGFVPRLLLGLILGYLYAWSGNLVVPMVAHFTQNAGQLLLLWLTQRGHLASVFQPVLWQA
jgi:membrane protease YdiL (CAAX protease family)